MKTTTLKKVLAMVLALAAIVTCFTACGKKDKTVPEAFQGKLMEPYIKQIMTENYTYESRPQSQDGKTTPITYAKAGKDRVMLTYQYNYNNQVIPLTFMKLDGKYYVLTSTNKVYTEATDEEVNKFKIKELFASADLDGFAQASFKSSGKAIIKDAEYQYEDYYSALNQIENRFFFDKDGKLVMIGKLVDGKVESYTPITLYETNESTFDVLNSYTFVPQNTGAATTTTAATTTAAQSADALK